MRRRVCWYKYFGPRKLLPPTKIPLSIFVNSSAVFQFLNETSKNTKTVNMLFPPLRTAPGNVLAGLQVIRLNSTERLLAGVSQPRVNFDSFVSSLLACFILITGEDW